MTGTDQDTPREEDSEPLATAIGLYALEEVSLGKAASIAGVPRWEMKEILTEHGIPIRLGPQSEEDLADEVDTALDIE